MEENFETFFNDAVKNAQGSFADFNDIAHFIIQDQDLNFENVGIIRDSATGDYQAFCQKEKGILICPSLKTEEQKPASIVAIDVGLKKSFYVAEPEKPGTLKVTQRDISDENLSKIIERYGLDQF